MGVSQFLSKMCIQVYVFFYVVYISTTLDSIGYSFLFLKATHKKGKIHNIFKFFINMLIKLGQNCNLKTGSIEELIALRF